MIARADVHRAFQALLDAAVGRGAWVVGRASGLHLHVAERATRPYRQGNFGVDVGAAFLIVALGKRTPMPYVWLPQGGLVPGGDGRSERCGVPQEWWKCLTRRNSSVRAHSSVGRAADS
jgi:hypothetical protein